MNWQKKGLIFNTQGEYDWNKSHAQCPVVDLVSESMWRIYYSTRNDKGQSQITFIEVEAGKPETILYQHDKYLFDFGKFGTFDDSGLMPTAVVTIGKYKYLYYIGWTLKKIVPYHNSIGLAISKDGGVNFEKVYNGSIMPPLPNEPYFTGTAFVRVESNVWRMWYLSCTEWIVINGEVEPKYHIKYCESQDGKNWNREGIVAIDYKNENEGGIASASVIKELGVYKMWFSYRNKFNYRANSAHSYRIGYATSIDGVSWIRKDELVNIRTSQIGWDSEMICYPNVIKFRSKYFMFYNGNGFGKSGFGYATLGI